MIPSEAAREIAAAAVPEHVDLDALREQTLVVGYPILPLLDQIVQRSPAAGRARSTGARRRRTSWTPAWRSSAPRARPRRERRANARRRGSRPWRRSTARTVMPGRTHAQPAVPITFGAQGGRVALGARPPRRAAAVARARVCGRVSCSAPPARPPRSGHGVATCGRRSRDGSASRAVRRAVAHGARRRRGSRLRARRTRRGSCGRLAREVDRAVAAGDRRAARGRRPPSRRVVDDAAEGESDRQRGGDRDERARRASRRAALLAALQGTHERSAGEWQIEWDAVPRGLRRGGRRRRGNGPTSSRACASTRSGCVRTSSSTAGRSWPRRR